MDFQSHGPSEPPEPANFPQWEKLEDAVHALRSASDEFENALECYRWAGRMDGPPEEVPREVHSDVVDIAEGLLLEVGAVRPVSAPCKPIEVPEPTKVCVFQVIVGIAFIGICLAAIDAWMR